MIEEGRRSCWTGRFMWEGGEVHGEKFMMQEGRFMLEREGHVVGLEAHGGELHDVEGRFMLEGERFMGGSSCWRGRFMLEKGMFMMEEGRFMLEEGGSC